MSDDNLAVTYPRPYTHRAGHTAVPGDPVMLPREQALVAVTFDDARPCGWALGPDDEVEAARTFLEALVALSAPAGHDPRAAMMTRSRRIAVVKALKLLERPDVAAELEKAL